ncbi:MAG: GtrA family protein [Treponema sp.]|nr:GtrA family protein [Treponema sp.]
MGSIKKKAKQIGKYSGVATFSTIINIVVRFLLSHVLNFHISVFIAYLVGSVINYILSAFFVFHYKERSHHLTWKSFWRFMMVSIFGFIATLLFSAIARYILFLCFPQDSKSLIELTAHLIGLGASFVCNFYGHSSFTFRKKSKKENKKED